MLFICEVALFCLELLLPAFTALPWRQLVEEVALILCQQLILLSVDDICDDLGRALHLVAGARHARLGLGGIVDREVLLRQARFRRALNTIEPGLEERAALNDEVVISRGAGAAGGRRVLLQVRGLRVLMHKSVEVN